jgi:hypothetical protein
LKKKKKKEFKAILGYVSRPCLENKTKTKNTISRVLAENKIEKQETIKK